MIWHNLDQTNIKTFGSQILYHVDGINRGSKTRCLGNTKHFTYLYDNLSLARLSEARTQIVSQQRLPGPRLAPWFLFNHTTWLHRLLTRATVSRLSLPRILKPSKRYNSSYLSFPQLDKTYFNFVIGAQKAPFGAKIVIFGSSQNL